MIQEFQGLMDLSQDPARGVEKIQRTQAWETALAALPSEEFLQVLPGLLTLNPQDPFLRLSLRKALLKRPDLERLLKDLDTSSSAPGPQAEILQLLGHLRSPQARSKSLQVSPDSPSPLRRAAVHVLGWVGLPEDIPNLTFTLTQDPIPEIRSDAAAAHFQIFHRFPEARDNLTASLVQGFYSETQDLPLGWIILHLQTITGKKFGLKESRSPQDLWTGTLEKAKLLVQKSFPPTP